MNALPPIPSDDVFEAAYRAYKAATPHAYEPSREALAAAIQAADAQRNPQASAEQRTRSEVFAGDLDTFTQLAPDLGGEFGKRLASFSDLLADYTRHGVVLPGLLSYRLNKVIETGAERVIVERQAAAERATIVAALIEAADRVIAAGDDIEAGYPTAGARKLGGVSGRLRTLAAQLAGETVPTGRRTCICRRVADGAVAHTAECDAQPTVTGLADFGNGLREVTIPRPPGLDVGLEGFSIDKTP